MSYFHAWIEGICADPAFSASVLADARHQCRYVDLPAAVGRVQVQLSSLGVSEGDCLALEPSNSVAGAVLLLAALSAGHSVVLSPARSGRRAELSVPAFCTWVIGTQPDASARQASLENPSAWLSVLPNPGFCPAPDAVPSAGGYCLLRSSGSLSTPKLVAHRVDTLLDNARNVQHRLGLDATHRVALPVPIFHMYGLGAGFLPALNAGASIDFLEGANVLTYLERERAFDPNVAFLTPTFCDFLLKVRRSRRPYQFIVTAGDTIAASVFDRMEELHGPLCNLYGSTEMGSVSVATRELSSVQRRTTAGIPYAQVEHRIVENAFDSEGERGYGELQLRYPFGFQGYVDPQGRFIDSSPAFDEGWFRTGDYGTANLDGTLRILGRRDLSVKRNGMLLPLSDIEHRLREIAGIRQAAVAVGGESIRGRRLVAFCTPEEGVTLSSAEVQRSYASGVPAYAVPEEFHIVPALPLLPNGKVDRRALAALARQGELQEQAPQ